jgi:hypothetical protein
MAFVTEGVTVDTLADKIFEQKAEIERLRHSLQTIADAADFIPADDLRKAARAALTAA